MPDKWVTIREAAKAAGVDERTVRRWVASGKVESVLSGGAAPHQRLIRSASLPVRGIGRGTAIVTQDHPLATPGNVTPDQGGYQSDNSALPALMEALTSLPTALDRQEDLLRRLVEAIEGQAAENRALREELASLHQTLKKLTPEAPKRRIWWQVWRR